MSKLEDELNHAMGTISDKEFSDQVWELIEALKSDWVESHPAPPCIAIQELPTSDYVREWNNQAQKGAKRQIVAARKGLEIERKATKRLRKLSKYQ